MSRKPYTPERAYRTSVLPLAGFLMIGGAVIFIAASFSQVPITWVPFVEPEPVKRLAMAVLGLVNVALGLGLGLKSRTAWIAFFGYLAVGTAWIVAGAFYDPGMGEEPDLAVAIAAPVFNSVLAAGIYAATKPVFRKSTTGP